MNEKSALRIRTQAALEQYFQRHSSPRLFLSFLLGLTGLVGFGISIGLLRIGISEMWIRYPISVLGAYGAFLGFIRVWVALERSRFDPREFKAPATGNRNGRGINWLDGLDPGCFFDAEGLLVVAVVVLIISLFVAVIDGPALLAEVFLDTFLVSALYRRLRIAAKEHWLGTAIRRTWHLAIVTALLLSIIGAILQNLSPGSRTIGPAIQHLFAGSTTL